MENSVVAVVPNAAVHHLRSVVLQILHEARLRFIHKVVLLVGRSTTLILRVVEPRSRRVRICAKVVYVQLFIHSHKAIVSLGVAGVIKGTVCFAADGSTSVRKLTSRIWLVGLIQRVGMVVCRLFSPTADGCMIASVVVDNVSSARADRGEVPNIERLVLSHVTHVAVD